MRGVFANRTSTLVRTRRLTARYPHRSMPTLTAALDPPYEIIIEPRGLDRLGEVTRTVAPSHRVILIADAQIAMTHGRRARRSLERAGYEIHLTQLAAEESNKTLEAVRNLYKAMLAAQLDRTCPVIALGGGLVGDVAGFAAATFLRGLPLVQVPTTLLAMVDASIGGKTGVNFALPSGKLGKNLIGAFHQPKAVLADPETLRTLDQRELRCGLAECIKHGMIADTDLLLAMGPRIDRILQLDTNTLTNLIEQSARVKVSIVEEDDREAGRRALLNLGHTFAHVLEPIKELDLKHGEAVAIGLCAAAHAAVLTHRLDIDDAHLVEALVEEAGLPTRTKEPVRLASLLGAMEYDKKVAQGKLRLVLPRGIGNAEIVSDVPAEVIAAAWTYVGAAAE